MLEQRERVEKFLRQHRIGLVTLMFTDMAGSTALKQKLGDVTAVELIHRHHALLRAIFSKFSEAEEISTAGDSFFLVFSKPSDAVRFSLLLHDGLRKLSIEANQTVSDRIGIHIGEVLITEEIDKSKDLYGIQVDTCARVMSLAAPGQSLITRSAFDNARQVLKGLDIESIGALSWLNHGPYLLKGVEEPIEICEVGEIGTAPLKAPANSEKAARHVTPEGESILGWRPANGQLIPGTPWMLESQLGEGAVGEVWLAFHQKLKQRRVFKFCFEAEKVRSLRREVTFFRLLRERIGNHPNIITVDDVSLEKPPFYLMLDFCDASDLRAWTERHGGIKNVPLAVRLEIIAQTADAMQAAHQAGIVHRDIKPSNILVAGGAAKPEGIQVKLVDFGISQVVSPELLHGVTHTGMTQTLASSSRSGTQMYMAPELIAGQPASTRSDIFSLGVVLYQFLIDNFDQPLTPDWTTKVDDGLFRDDLSRCFAGEPEKRFSGAQQLAQNLRGWQKRHRNKKRAFAVGAGLAAIMMGLILSAQLFRNPLDKLHYRIATIMQNTTTPNEAVVVKIDDECFEHFQLNYGQPIPRSLHARVVDKLNELDARTIVFDIIFSEPGDAQETSQLSQAMKRRSNVVIAAHMNSGENGVSQLFLPHEQFTNAAASIGFVSSWFTTDRIISGLPSNSGKILPLSAAAFANFSRQEKPVWDPTGRLIQFYKAGVPNLNYKTLLSNRFERGFLKDKAVFIGIHAAPSTLPSSGYETFFSPFGEINEVDVVATSFLNQLHDHWLRNLPPALEFLSILAFGAVAGISCVLFGPLPSLAASVLLFSFCWFWPTSYVLPWLHFAAEFLTAVSCALLYRLSKNFVIEVSIRRISSVRTKGS